MERTKVSTPAPQTATPPSYNGHRTEAPGQLAEVMALPILTGRAGPPREEWQPSPVEPDESPAVTWMLWTGEAWLPVAMRLDPTVLDRLGNHTFPGWQLWHPIERRWLACMSPYQSEHPFPGGRPAA